MQNRRAVREAHLADVLIRLHQRLQAEAGEALNVLYGHPGDVALPGHPVVGSSSIWGVSRSEASDPTDRNRRPSRASPTEPRRGRGHSVTSRSRLWISASSALISASIS